MAVNRTGRYMYLTTSQRLARGEWPWDEGIRSRFPNHFKRRYLERYTVTPRPIHWIKKEGKWEVDEFGVRTKVDNVPIPVIYPEPSQKGLWGGEGFVQGLQRKKDDEAKPAWPRLWKPMTQKRVFYSEILDKYLAINVTFSTLDQIDQAYGFDNYILKTHEVDLKSKLGMLIKADMIRALINKSIHPNNPTKRDEIYERYKQFIVPEEELEWYGLTLEEAEVKQEKLEEEAKEAAKQPLKYQLMEKLVQDIKGGTYGHVTKGDEKSYLGNFSLFKSQQ